MEDDNPGEAEINGFTLLFAVFIAMNSMLEDLRQRVIQLEQQNQDDLK